MTAVTAVTAVQSLYLLYMFFLFETTYDFDNAPLDSYIQSFGDFFKHSTTRTDDCVLTDIKQNRICDNRICDNRICDNRICDMGRVVATLLVLFWGIRISARFVRLSIGIDLICLFLAYLLNLNALVYSLPLVFGEAYVLYLLSKK
jgi:hypothetical protein